MSQRWDQVEERLDDYEAQIDAVYRLYHIPIVLALMAFMLWTRARDYERHISEGGEPLYRGNDPFYHYRTTTYVVENYPFNMPFDPWTSFDVGTRVGQFGTIMDQIVATAALIVGLGSPDQETILMVTLFAGPVFAMLCAIPMYLIGKRLGGRFGGIVAVLVLALTPGQFMSRSVAGYYGHHVTEVLFTLLALLAGMLMLTAAQREKPIYELVETREWEPFRTTLLWAVAFGTALAVATLNWPPAVFLSGVFAVFLFVHLSLEFLRGHSPDHVAIPTVVAMGTTVLLLLPFLRSLGLQTTDYSLAQVLIPFAVAVGAVVMAGIARNWDRLREQVELPRAAYPVVVVGAGLVGLAVVSLVVPDFLDFLISQFRRVASLGATDTRATIGEAQAPDNPVQFFYSNYGLAFFTAMLGLVLLAVRLLFDERPRAEYLLVLVFSVFVLLFTLTQIRFDYYLVIAVAAANAYLVGRIYRFVDLDDVRRDISNVKPYQILIVAAILFVIAGPMLATGATLDGADRASTPGEMTDWGESLDWLSENTPEVGAYGTGDAGDDPLELYGTYDVTEDHEYREGEYGVMAWWDYGHYITTRGERIPVANPFQQHATEAADFLLAGDEEQAVQILEEDQGEGEGVRYVMIDYQMAFAGTDKYNAPTAFESRHDLEGGDLVNQYVFSPAYLQVGQFFPAYGVHSQRSYESMRVRLYQFHGSAREPATFVTRWETRSVGGGEVPVPTANSVEDYGSPEAAAEAAQGDPNTHHGGVLGYPQERVEALQHFRLVHASEPGEFQRNLRGNQPYSPYDVQRAIQDQQPIAGLQPAVKTFERVPGATIEGTGPPNAEVQASVEMVVPTTGQTFYYNQFAETDDEGNWEMVVPYSTTGYDEWGTEEGYTNVDVRATGDYRFVAFPEDSPQGWTGQATVTEGQVLGEDPTPVEVDLQEPGGDDEGDEGSADEEADGQERSPALTP